MFPSKPTLVLGDLHGDIQTYKGIRDNTTEDLILVGDLVDSFLYSRTEQLALVEEVLNDIEAGRTRCIKGNHELSYLYPHMRCTGFGVELDTQLIHLKNRMHRLMEPYIWEEEASLLITHSGLTNYLYTDKIKSPKKLDDWLFKNIRDIDSIAYAASRARGGTSKYPGIFWCDYWVDFKPIKGIIQIFGHTEVSDVYQANENTLNFNIDCLQHVKKVLRLLPTNQIEILTFDDSFKIATIEQPVQ